MSTKLRLLKCYVRSTLLYGRESWTVSQRMKLQLEADRNVVFTAYVWTDKVSNEEVFKEPIHQEIS